MANYLKKTLLNGLRLITVPLKGTRSVTVLVSVAAGSRYESKQLNGISHFLEHMFFKGTKKRPTAFDITSLIDSVGGVFNAHTGKESTGFYIKTAAKHLPLSLDVLTDILTSSLFNPQEIEKERGVIIEEINMREDMPMATVSEVFDALLYSPTPLGQRIIGQKENIKRIQRKDFLAYLERFYRPKNMVVTVAGECSRLRRPFIQKILSLADSRLTVRGVPAGHLRRGTYSFSQTKPQLKLHYKKTEQAHFCLGVRAFKRIHPDRYVLAVLATILGGNMSSRLFTEVREKRGLAYYIKTDTSRFQETGHLVSQAGVDIGKIQEAIKVILNEYRKMANSEGQIANSELKKAKEFLKGRLILALEDSYGVAELYADGELLENKIRTPEEIIKGIEKVTVSDLARVAKKIFLPKNLNLAVIGPYKKEAPFLKLLTRF